MTITPRSVNLTALMVLGCVCVSALFIGGSEAALAVLAGGALMVGSMVLTTVVLRPGVPVQLASTVVTLKLPLLGLGIWKLLSVFDVVPVVVGGSSVVAAAVLLSLLSRLNTFQPVEA